jgi:hypothetical protein
LVRKDNSNNKKPSPVSLSLHSTSKINKLQKNTTKKATYKNKQHKQAIKITKQNAATKNATFITTNYT